MIDEPLSHNIKILIRDAANTAKQFQDLTRLLDVDLGFMFKEDKGFKEGAKTLEGRDSMLAAYLRTVLDACA